MTLLKFFAKLGLVVGVLAFVWACLSAAGCSAMPSGCESPDAAAVDSSTVPDLATPPDLAPSSACGLPGQACCPVGCRGGICYDGGVECIGSFCLDGGVCS